MDVAQLVSDLCDAADAGDDSAAAFVPMLLGWWVRLVIEADGQTRH